MSLSSNINDLAVAIATDVKNLRPKLNRTVELTANYTVLATDAATSFVYNGGTPITLTFPDALPTGFYCRVYQAGLGTVSFSYGTRIQFGNASRVGTSFQWDVADIELFVIASTPIFMQIFNLALPVLYAKSTADAVRNATTMTAITGLSIPLEINSAYDVNILVPFTSVIATNTLRIGLLALPTGATCQFEVSVWNAVAAGTAPKTNHIWTSSALAVTGTGGTAAVVGSTMLASVTGRIITSSTAGNIAVTCGSIAATGNVTVASGTATMSVSKVFDQGRT